MGSITGLEKLEAGQYGGILFPDQYADFPKRGMVAATPGSVTVHNLFRASVYLFSAVNGVRDHAVPFAVSYPAIHGFRPQICPFEKAYIHHDCVAELPTPQQTDYIALQPDTESEVVIQTLPLIPLGVGGQFNIFQGPQMVGRGKVIQVLDNVN